MDISFTLSKYSSVSERAYIEHIPHQMESVLIDISEGNKLL